MKNHRLRTPLTQDTFVLDPEFQAMLELSNQISWVFSVSMGRNGGKQIPLACDVNGVLTIEDSSGGLAELFGQLNGDDTDNSPLWYNFENLAEILSESRDANVLSAAGLKSTEDLISLANYFDSIVASPPLYSTQDGYPLADYFDSVRGYEPFFSVNDGCSLAAYFDSGSSREPLYYMGHSGAYYLYCIYNLLYDMSSGGNNSTQMRIDTIT